MTYQVLDSHQGQGYKTRLRAYRAYAYLSSDQKKLPHKQSNQEYLADHPELLELWNDLKDYCGTIQRPFNVNYFQDQVADLYPDFPHSWASLFYLLQERCQGGPDHV